MDRKLTADLWRIPIGVLISVLASLAGVWLLSQAVGFRFMPAPVAAIGGSLSVCMLGTWSWRTRSDRG
jgi:hypothetical protein